MALPDTITIKFKPEGDRQLTNAIKSLDRATKSLLNSQAKLVDKEVQRNKTVFSGRNQLKAMFLELKKVDSGFKQAGISTEMFTRALKGDRVALRQAKEATDRLVRSKNNLSKGMFDTEHSTRILGGSFAVLRSKMLLASFGAGLFGATIGRVTRLAGEQELAERKLTTAIGRRSEALLAFASEQQKVTVFGDEETIQAMSLLGAYTDNEKAIARLTEVSMDLASAKGMDLNTAIDLVGKSVFSSTNALSRYGVTIEGTQGSSERLESATKALSALYGGQAKQSAETFLGSMTQLGNSVGDLGERFGSIFIPVVLASAKGIKAFADSIDTEEIKAYGVALVGVAGTYLVVTKGAVALKTAMMALNKVSRKNLLLLAGMVAVGAVIDKFDIFADSTADVDKAMKDLEGSLGKLNNKNLENNLIAEAEIELLRKKHELLQGGLNLDEQLILIGNQIEMNARLRSEGMITEIEMRKRNMELTNQQLTLEEKIEQAKVKTVSSGIGALGNLNKAMKGSAEVSKRLAQAQAIIDTYAGANLALRSGLPPFNFIAMAGVIAKGLANVATIEAQQFAKGGDFVTNKPELIMVGEAGREHVQITPVDRPQERALKTSGVTINIEGGIVDQDYVVNTLIPAINASGQAIA